MRPVFWPHSQAGSASFGSATLRLASLHLPGNYYPNTITLIYLHKELNTTKSICMKAATTVMYVIHFLNKNFFIPYINA